MGNITCRVMCRLEIEFIPVVPHKAVAEVSKIGTYRRDWSSWVADGRAKTLMDRQVVHISSFSPSELPKVVGAWCSFSHFDFKMCFTPQQRAIFSNFEKVVRSLQGINSFFLKMCFAPQRRAICHFISGHRAPHPPL